MYGKINEFDKAFNLYFVMEEKGIKRDIITFNTIIEIYLNNNQSEEALLVVMEMKKEGVLPNELTFKY